MNHQQPIKRRQFIIKSAQAASLLALSGTAYGIGGCAPEEKKLGVALLGLGGYATAQSFKTMKEELPGMEETIFWQMEFPSGAVANCTSSYVGRENYIRVSAQKGVFGLEPAFSYNGLAGYINGDAMPTHEHNQQAAQMDAFALNIKEDTPVIASGEEGLRDMVIIEAIYEAAVLGKK